MSRILIKFPTRSRYQKALSIIQKYIDFANDIEYIQIIVSVDQDDNPEKYIISHPSVTIKVGPSEGKVAAINRDMPDPSTFDILLLASDDMIPVIKGYDDIIRLKMLKHFPDRDGVLFFNDGFTHYNLNTLVICGSKYYQRFGYIYYPEYKSLFCDNEFMDEANKLGRQIYLDNTIIKHEHPSNVKHVKPDNLYKKNESLWEVDKILYNSRKSKSCDLSILICTIPERKSMFIKLLNRLTLLKQKTSLTVEVLFDNTKNTTIGKKRNNLLDRAVGTYCCFVDDDDQVTDDYYSVIEESKLEYDCISLNGMVYTDGVNPTPFFHSLQYISWWSDNVGHYRNPNHLNPIKTSIAKQIQFTDKNHGEDHDFSTKLLKSGLLKTEYKHNKLQYLYFFVKKPEYSNPVTKPIEFKVKSVNSRLNLFKFKSNTIPNTIPNAIPNAIPNTKVSSIFQNKYKYMKPTLS
jgi:hypothetical protein